MTMASRKQARLKARICKASAPFRDDLNVQWLHRLVQQFAVEKHVDILQLSPENSMYAQCDGAQGLSIGPLQHASGPEHADGGSAHEWFRESLEHDLQMLAVRGGTKLTMVPASPTAISVAFGCTHADSSLVDGWGGRSER